MLEFLFEILGEIVLQIFLEALAELGMRSVAAPFQKRSNPWMAAVGYAIFGAAVGGISLLLMPAHLVRQQTLRIFNLLVTPVAVGLLMSVLGTWRARRGHALLRIDRFAYGYLFALSLAVIRFAFAK